MKKCDNTSTADNKSEAYEDILVTVDVGDIQFLPQSTELEEIKNIATRALGYGHMEAKTDVIKCNQCSYTTDKETTMNNHIQSKHELSLNCGICPFVCAQKHNLKQHISAKRMLFFFDE